MKFQFRSYRFFSLIVGLLLCLPAVWPYLQPRFFHLHDFTHVARLAELERGFKDGQMPVRWSENLGYGYGMPQFSFYGPLFYSEALGFRFLGISYVWAIKLAVILQVVLSFIAIYFLSVMLWGEPAGIVAGIAGIYAPYRLVDMYVRGAFAELSGMTWVAWTLLVIVWWAKKPTWIKAVGVSLCGTGILLSHTLMAIISVPFIVLWILYWTISQKRLRTHITHVVVIGVLTIGLSAFFTLPALFEKSFTQADQLTTGFSNYNHHFLYIRQLWNSTWGYGGSIWGLNDNVSFELGKIQLVLWILSGIFVFIVWVKRKQRPDIFIVLSSLLVVSLFLTILKSKVVWDALPIMLFIQFPWRYLSISVIVLALLNGITIQITPKKTQFWFILVVVSAIILSQIRRIHPESYLSNDELLYYSDPVNIQKNMSDIIPDFLPKTASVSGLPTAVAQAGRFTVSQGVPAVVEINRSHEFLIRLQAHGTFPFTAHIFDFPGWTLYYDGEEIPHSTDTHGFITASIPEGAKESFLSGRFEETPLRMTADWISCISLVIATALLLKKEKTS